MPESAKRFELSRQSRPGRDIDDFGPQRTSTACLPSPEVFVRNMVRGVLEVVAGVRDAEQLARWMSEDVFRRLVARTSIAARARSARRVQVYRVVHEIGSIRLSSPTDGVIEATVTASGRTRTRAIAMRLEGIDGRWRVTALCLL